MPRWCEGPHILKGVLPIHKLVLHAYAVHQHIGNDITLGGDDGKGLIPPLTNTDMAGWGDGAARPALAEMVYSL